jgi:hypothetical protein
MTDEILANTEAASAPQELQPISDQQVPPPAPGAPPKAAEAAPPKEKQESRSLREIIREASSKVDATNGPARNPDGTFAAVKPPAPIETQPKAPGQKASEAKPAPVAAATDAPARFSADAKAHWETAPEPVKAEVNRAIKELETGIEKYRSDATAYEPLRKYDQLAKQHNTDVPAALERYMAFERALFSPDVNHKMAAIKEVAALAQVDLAQVFGGQPPKEGAQQPQAPTQPDPALNQVQQQLTELKSQIAQRDLETVQTQLATWAKDKPHVEQLADQIAVHVNNGMDLDAAYDKALSDARELATKMFGASPASAPVPKPALPAQNSKGHLSVTGTPGASSYQANPNAKRSVRESIQNAMARVG